MTQEELKNLLHYDPETGIFTWKVRTSDKTYPGKRAGTLHPDRYVIIAYRKKRYLAYRLAFLYMTGRFPQCEVDHVNLMKGDNRWCNLREADRSTNNANKGLQKNNTSGLKGVSWCKANGRWFAQIEVRGIKPYLGYFDTPEDAYAAYTAAARMHFKEYARFRA